MKRKQPERLRNEGAAAPPDDGHFGSFTLPDDTVLPDTDDGVQHPDTNQSPLPERHREERQREKRRAEHGRGAHRRGERIHAPREGGGHRRKRRKLRRD